MKKIDIKKLKTWDSPEDNPLRPIFIGMIPSFIATAIFCIIMYFI